MCGKDTKEIKEIKEVKDSSLNSLNSLNSLTALPLEPRLTQDDIVSNIALRVSLHRANLPSPLNHGVTLSQCHIDTGGGGSVITVRKCDKVWLTTPRLIRDC